MVKAIQFILLSAASVPILYAIIQYGVDIPYWDQWEFMPFFQFYKEDTLTLTHVLQLHNEYRQFIPHIFFLGMGLLTKWQVKYEMVASWFMVVYIGWVVTNNLKRLQLLTPGWYVVATTYILTLLFTPAQFENWLFGIQFVYFLPAFCLVLCLQITLSPIKRGYAFFLISLIAFACTLSSANGFLCWLAMLPILFSSYPQKNGEKVIYWLGATLFACSSLAIYMLDYQQPGNLPTIWQKSVDVNLLLHFMVRLSGNIVGPGNNLTILELHGIVVLLAMAGSIVYLLWLVAKRKDIHVFLPWLILGLYGFFTNLLITFGRSNLGIFQANAPRYIGFSLFCSIAFLIIPVLMYQQSPENKKLRIIAQFAIIWMVFISVFKWFYVNEDYNRLKEYSSQISRAKVGVLLSNIIPLEENQTPIYPSNFSIIKQKVDWLNSENYIRPSLLENPTLPDHRIQSLPPLGSFDQFTSRNDTLLAMGLLTVLESQPSYKAIILTAKNPLGERTIIGMDNSGKSSWNVTVPQNRLPSDAELLEAWQVDATNLKFHKIQGSHALR